MKKVLFMFLVPIMFYATNMSAQKKVKIIDVKGIELAIAVDVDDKSSFKEFFLFQYEKDIDLSGLLASTEIFLLDFDVDFVKLRSNDKIYLFTLNSDLIKENEIGFSGYGLSHRKGNYSISKVDKGDTIMDVLLLNDRMVSSLTCHSGGEGSTECSVDSSPISGGGGCSVKCGKGYYSCCDDTKNECRCKAEKKTVSLSAD